MDIFKAIFASDDEDSDEEDDGGAGQEEEGVPDAAGPSTSTSSPKRPDEQQQPTERADAVPLHLRANDGAEHVPTYEPRSVGRPSPAGAEAVDTATFKPVFVPRAARETQTQKVGDKKKKKKEHDDRDRGKDKDKEKKRAKAIVSFEDDDEGAALVIAPQVDKAARDGDKARKKKKRRKEKGNVEGEGEEDAEMWIEKAPPQVVASFDGAPPAPPTGGEVLPGAPAPLSSSSTLARAQAAEGPPRGRKRAIDFI
jgi:G patch domain-containing protein 1